jgi:hypothetical protein
MADEYAVEAKRQRALELYNYIDESRKRIAYMDAHGEASPNTAGSGKSKASGQTEYSDLTKGVFDAETELGTLPNEDKDAARAEWLAAQAPTPGTETQQETPGGSIQEKTDAGLSTLEGGIDSSSNIDGSGATSETPAPDATPRTMNPREGFDPSLGEDLAGLSTGTGGLAGGSISGGPRVAGGTRSGPRRMGGFDTSGVNVDAPNAAGGAQQPVAPAPGAPQITSESVNKILGGLNTYGGQMVALAGDNTGLSAAEAALTKASREADIRSGIATEASQRGALGAARSLRSRGDRALGERQAIGESSFIGQEAARNDALREAEQEGQLGQLRATEADSDRRFKLDALKEAASLGLNTAALEIDVSKTNLGAAMSWINNEFQTHNIELQLSEQQAEAALNFTQGMAAIQYEYDKLSVDDQNTADALLMQRYGIDQNTMLQLKELKQKSQVNWGQVLTGFAGGVGSGLTTAIASDVRVKQDFGDPGDEDITELFGALNAQTYKYKQPAKHGQGLQFGFMAQALEGTRLGKAMVAPDHEGTKRVDTGRVAMATAAGLSHVLERLSALESAVN